MYVQIQTLAAAVLAFSTFVNGQQNKRQVGGSQSGIINTDEDRDAAETGFGANIGGHGKYFQDIYSVQLAPDKLEFGHVCEGPHDWEQRYERKDFGANKHQGKVRWGDKHGGYGEHYWDYNHAGHDGDGEESQAVEEYEAYEPSESSAKPIVKNNNAGIREYTPRAKRHEHLNENMKFVYDPATGVLMDEISGKKFKLQPLS